MHLTPASLLLRLRKPEETASWSRFVELYTPLLYHWARQVGEQHSDASDLVQDVFLILWRKLPDFVYDRDRSFHAWLKTIFLNRHRGRQRQRLALPLDVDGHDRADDSLGDFGDPEYAKYLTRQAFRLIENEFSPLHQAAFRAYVLEERPAEGVAADLGIGLGTVYSIKSKILSRLRQELQHLLD